MEILRRVSVIGLRVLAQGLRSLPTSLIALACSMLISMQVVSEERVHVSLNEYVLVDSLPKSFEGIKQFSSLSLDARIVPGVSNDSFEFLVNFSSVPAKPNVSPPSSFRTELIGESCSEPLEFSLRKVSKDYQYSYHTFDESFSPLSGIDIDLEYIGITDKKHVYFAQVNGQEKIVATDKKIEHVGLYVSGANVEIEQVVINNVINKGK